MSADADRIAALEAELAEARGLPRQCAALGHTQKIAGFCAECAPDATPMQRLDAAQERASAAQAAEARAKKLVADVRAVWNSTKAAHAAEVQAAQAEAAAMRDWCAAWLIRARLAIYREGWEEGMSVREAGDALTSVLFNLGCDDGSERAHDIAETKRLLAMPITYSPPAGRALAARVPLWRELERGAVSSLPGGMTCVRHLSHLTSDCAEAFSEPRCPQCIITAAALKLAALDGAK